MNLIKPKIEQTVIEDCYKITPTFNIDLRGEIYTTWNTVYYDLNKVLGWPKDSIFVEDKVSTSIPGTFRGLHGDFKTGKLIRCLYGKFRLIIIDLRRRSSYLKYIIVDLDNESKQQVLIPPGCINGHYVPKDLTNNDVFLYKQTSQFSRIENQLTVDLFSLRSMLPDINIDEFLIGNKNPILSDRDKNGKSLKETIDTIYKFEEHPTYNGYTHIEDNSLLKNESIVKKIKGIIQIGAAHGEELSAFVQNGIKNIICIEPIPNNIDYLNNYTELYNKQYESNIMCYQCAISNVDGKSDFHISSNGTNSSSLLNWVDDSEIKFGDMHKESETIQVNTYRLDTFIQLNNININLYNTLYIDCQGVEYEVLIGAEDTLKHIDFIFVDVSFVEIYKHSMLFKNLNEYIEKLGFKMIDLTSLKFEFFGDALYVRKDFVI